MFAITYLSSDVRTSGTEPKVRDGFLLCSELTYLGMLQIKYYLEGSGNDKEAVAELLPRVVEELATEWMQAKANGLGRP